MYNITNDNQTISITEGQIVSVSKYWDAKGNASYFVTLSGRGRYSISADDYTAIQALMTNTYTLSRDTFEMIIQCGNSVMLEKYTDSATRTTYFIDFASFERMNLTTEEYNAIGGLL